MDAGFMARELAEILGVTECTVYNWGVRGVRPSCGSQEQLGELIWGDQISKI
jgi:transposase